MTFGVLHVRSRDGRTIEHELTQASTVVGRADDSGVPIRDASVARRHARIIVENGQAFVQDMGSAGGTFVNGDRLDANERMPILPSDTLKFGDVEAMYGESVATAAPDLGPIPPAVPVPAPTAESAQPSYEPAPTPVPPPVAAYVPPPPPPVANPTANIPLPVANPMPAPTAPVSSAARMDVTIAMDNNRVDPGGVTVAKVTVHNRGTTVEQVGLALSGLPAEWYTLAPPNINLLPGSRVDATLTIRPPKLPDTTAGERSFSVVASQRVSGAEASATSSVHIQPFEAATYELSPRQSSGDFRVNIQNGGNRAVRLQFAGDDAEAKLQYEFTPPMVEVAPGESRTTQVKVRTSGRPLTGTRSTVQFALQVVPDGGTKRELPGVLTVDPRFGKGLPLKPIFAILMLAVAAGLAYLFIPRGGDTPATPETPGPSASATAAANGSAVAANVDFLCGPEALPASPAPVAGQVRPAPAILAAARTLVGADPSSPLFAQNDTRWAAEEYAKAKDDAFREQNACGSTIAQCGCAMTSVATVMALFQLVTMPDGTALTPEAVNAWFNVDARRTASGWVSQGYIYGNVIWAAANQLSGAIKQANPQARTVRFKTTGTGSEEQIRSELAAGRPVVLEVPGHWIAAIGIDKTTNKILINDPYYADRTTLDVYAGKVRSSVLFETSDSLAAVVVSVPSSSRVKVTDDQGRVTGTADTGPAEETPGKATTAIPGSTYTFTSAWRDPTCTEKMPKPGTGTIQITLPSGAGYTIEVTSPTKAGTSVAVHAYDDKGNVVIHTQDAPGDMQVKMTPNTAGGGQTVTAATAVASPTKPTTGTGGQTVTAPATAGATTAVPTTAVPTTAVPTTAVPTTAVPTTPAPTGPVVKSSCSEPTVVLVGSFPAERTINCQIAIDGKYDTITWYYNHGRCEPPRGGGVCDGSALAYLAQWDNSTAIRNFGAYTEKPETFTFIAEVCLEGKCVASYYYVEFRLRG